MCEVSSEMAESPTPVGERSRTSRGNALQRVLFAKLGSTHQVATNAQFVLEGLRRSSQRKKTLGKVDEGFRIDYRFVVISRSKNIDRVKDNLNIMDFEKVN